LILVTALTVRLVAAYWWQARLGAEKRFAFGDSESYWRLGQSIARGESYEYGTGMRVFRTPGYPIALAGLFTALQNDDPPVLYARFLGAALGTLTVALIMWLARELFDPATAVIAGAMAAVYPGAISLSIFVLSEALFCPLMVLQLVAWIIADRTKGRTSLCLSSAAGVAGGLATLARPSWLLFAPLAMASSVINRDSRLHRLRIGAVVLLAMAATLTPWWVRNHSVTGRFVMTTLQVGASLYDGLNPAASGASDMGFVTQFVQEQTKADQQPSARREGTFEQRLDQRLRMAAIAWAEQNPDQVLRLAGVKFLRMWSPWPNAAEMQSVLFRLAILLGYTPLLLLGFWGLAVRWRQGWPYRMLALPAAYFTALHVVFVSSIRYREPAMLVWIVLAGSVLASGSRAVTTTGHKHDA
jgi:4-amino-4-deoxy-L-arabinose transferase-like glycosyltransferase